MSSSSPHHKPIESKATVVVEDGGKVIIKPKALYITWGADNHYWNWLDKGDNNSETSAVELLQVCWLEVRGSLMLSKLVRDKEYMVNFKVSMKPDAFGWTGCAVWFMAKPGVNTKTIWKRVDLSTPQSKYPVLVPGSDLKFTTRSTEPFWVPGSALKFTTPTAASDDKLQFGIYEIWKGNWKGGLVIHEVVIEPVGGPA